MANPASYEGERLSRYLYRPWWSAEGEDVGHAAWSLVKHLQDQQSSRRDTLLRNMRLYSGTQVDGYGPYTYARLPSQPFRAADRLTLNVIASNIDTLTSKVAKHQPRPRFLTRGGNFTEQRKAQNLQRFVDGQFYRLEAYQLGVGQFRDCAWAGTGITYWYREGSDIKAERVFPGELLIDPKEAIYGQPRQAFRVRYVDRGVLMGLYPEAEFLGDTDPVESPEFGSGGGGLDQARDQIKVIQAWHLPSHEGAKDGRYAAVVSNGVLEESPWTRDEFPFVALSWRSGLLGFWGSGVSDELTGIQIEINKLLRKIQDAFHLLAVPWVLRETGSQVNPQKIANTPGLILDYTGTPPTVVTHQTVHPEVFAYLDSLVQRSYEITGVSQLSAQSQKPAGLNSGRALQEFSDIESERFMEMGRKYEQMFLDYTSQILTLAREIDEDPTTDSPSVNAISGREIIKLKWSEVSLDDDAYVMQVFPTSALPTHPAAKLDKVMELMQGGLVDPQMAMKLLEFPDLEAYADLRDAPIDDIEAQIEDLLDGKYSPPEPFQDLQRALPMVQSAYLRAKRNGASEKILDGLRRWMSEVQALQQRVMAAEQAQMAPQGPMQPPPAGEAPMGVPGEPMVPPGGMALA